ncbi:helix-turn-helix domain-containing protein [Acidithiobacillus ferriphilus]|uniref:helix-turn-helix domain-containing protein n=1 Tax=Acidithiobacillus ferriphilus TaxID=1689834 RepID=UPI001C064E18|nr:helix-turn-helix transcriptional regulator [Acidithiobacillus ferriphilus]MBU2827097.1 helix-turn-helix transcriptional regulator [Acidithiobacillus ferriphilus]
MAQHEDPIGQGAILAVKRSDVRTAQQHLANIRQVLNPAITDLAIVFDVSRQAIYKWLSGDSTPEPDKLARIVELSDVADAFRDAGVSRAAALLKMKAFDGRSLLDLIAAGEGCSQHVQTLVAEAKAIEAAYERTGLAKSKAKPTSDWQSSMSIPGSLE